MGLGPPASNVLTCRDWACPVLPWNFSRPHVLLCWACLLRFYWGQEGGWPTERSSGDPRSPWSSHMGGRPSWQELRVPPILWVRADEEAHRARECPRKHMGDGSHPTPYPVSEGRATWGLQGSAWVAGVYSAGWQGLPSFAGTSSTLAACTLPFPSLLSTLSLLGGGPGWTSQKGSALLPSPECLGAPHRERVHQTHMHTPTHTRAHAHTQCTHSHTRTHTRAHACIHAHVRAHTQALHTRRHYTHTRTDAHTQTRAHTHRGGQPPAGLGRGAGRGVSVGAVTQPGGFRASLREDCRP